MEENIARVTIRLHPTGKKTVELASISPDNFLSRTTEYLGEDQNIATVLGAMYQIHYDARKLHKAMSEKKSE